MLSLRMTNQKEIKMQLLQIFKNKKTKDLVSRTKNKKASRTGKRLMLKTMMKTMSFTAQKTTKFSKKLLRRQSVQIKTICKQVSAKAKS